MRIVCLLIFFAFALKSEAQYWIGPKFGFHYTGHDYQEEEYESLYRIANDLNFEGGIVINYTASERYSVHGELYYEGQGSRIRSKKEFYYVDSQSNFRYLSAPILLRVSMGHKPVHWYLNGGPKLSLWLGGRGHLKYSDDASANIDGIEEIDYKIVFRQSKAEGLGNGAYYVNEANRIQYSLTVGGGFYLDLANGARLMIDCRYNWGHSNMGFNINPQNANSGAILLNNTTNIPEEGYQENYEYSHNTLSFSIGYMFEYNTELKRKGSSTNADANKTKKSAKQKKKQ